MITTSRMRRHRAATHVLVCAALLGCVTDPDEPDVGNARIEARPHTPSASLAPGTETIGNASGGSSLLFVPASYRRNEPIPVVILLHGAGRSAAEMTGFTAYAQSSGFILIMPKSNGPTWDIGLGGFGPDVQHLDNLLDYVFDRATVANGAVAIGGFSDGASYALSLGLTNGDLFGSIVAFSPGYKVTPERRGKPRVFVSHGTADAVLPVGNARKIVQELTNAGYAVRFEEFAGGHEMPAQIRAAAMEWLDE